MRSWLGHVTEMIVPNWMGGGLRSAWRIVNHTFFPSTPIADKTTLNYDLCRQLYRNDGDDTRLGAGFCKPIIDRAVEFMGIPQVDSDDEDRDGRLNTYISKYWATKWNEAVRNAMRDSKCVIRISQPYLTDKLVSAEERAACMLTVYEPERVVLTTDPQNPNSVIKAVVVSMVEFPDPKAGIPDPQRNQPPTVKEHEIWEIITPESYRYYDMTDRRWLDDWQRKNTYGFVAFIEMWNEYDSALSGGISDFEPVFSFLKAFHEVMLQALKAHGYHSIPKLKFKVADINGFLLNNFPDTLDENKNPIPGAKISWKGREVLILGQEDDLGFIEMKSILGDSKVLLELLLHCISVSSETPQEFLMLTEAGESDSGAGILAFEKKIDRKRVSFQPYLQRVVKMCEVINGREPITVDVLWEEIRTQTILDLSQALQQITMSLEVLLERKLISDNTAREAIRSLRLFKRMKAPKQEAIDAQDNEMLGVLSPPGPGQPELDAGGKPKLKALPAVVPSGGPGARN